jgi:hypothetical protein
MGFLDKLKGLVRGRKSQIEKGIDKAADIAEKKLPDNVAGKVDDVAEKAKDALDKLD